MRVENVAAPHEGAGPAPPLLGWSCSRRFQARPDVVSTELVGLNQTLVQLGLPIEPLFTLELVLAEVLNNIVEHAYGDTGQGMIGMSMVVREHRITCEVTDRGAPMPNGRLPPPRRHDPEALGLQDLPEGGFGWGLIHDMTTALDYSRAQGTNRLCFGIDLET